MSLEADRLNPLAARIRELESSLSAARGEADFNRARAEEAEARAERAEAERDHLRAERRELQGRIALAVEARKCCDGCLMTWLVGELDADQKLRVDAAQKRVAAAARDSEGGE